MAHFIWIERNNHKIHNKPASIIGVAMKASAKVISQATTMKESPCVDFIWSVAGVGKNIVILMALTGSEVLGCVKCFFCWLLALYSYFILLLIQLINYHSEKGGNVV